MSDPIPVLYGTKLSGHTHRVELLLRFLGVPYRFQDTPASVRRDPAFRRLNLLQQIPVLEVGDLVIQDSNAILVYLAKRHDPSGHWLPDDPAGAARVQRWLSVAAGEVAYGPAMARVILQFGTEGDVPRAQAIAARLLGDMEQHVTLPYVAADHPTIADLACYSYVAHAPEGGISLEPFPAVRAWLARIEAIPGFVPMPRRTAPVGRSA